MAEQDYAYAPIVLKDYDTYGDDATDIDAYLLGHMQDGIVKAHELIKNNMISEDGKAILDELIKKKQEQEDAEKEEANKLKFESFTVTYYTKDGAHYSGSFEVGTAVTKIEVKCEFNKPPKTLTFNGDTSDNEDEKKLTFTFTDTGEFRQDQSWRLSATDENGKTISNSAYISFFSRTYYGTSNKNLSLSVNRNEILGLDQTGDGSFLSSFTVTAAEDEYIYYCLPSSFGECEFNIDGWVGGFIELVEGEFVNASNGVKDYRIYRSEEKGLGNTTVNVFQK